MLTFTGEGRLCLCVSNQYIIYLSIYLFLLQIWLRVGQGDSVSGKQNGNQGLYTLMVVLIRTDSQTCIYFRFT